MQKNITKIYEVGDKKRFNIIDICVSGIHNETKTGGILATDTNNNKLKIEVMDDEKSVYVKNPKSAWFYIGRYIEHESDCNDLGTQLMPSKLPLETIYEHQTFMRKLRYSISLANVLKMKVNFVEKIRDL